MCASIACAHDGGQGGALIRRDDQQVGLLANERLHLRDLFAVILLRVGDDQLHAAGFGEQFLHQRVLRGAIRLGVIALAEGDEVLLLLCRRICCRSPPPAEQRRQNRKLESHYCWPR